MGNSQQQIDEVIDEAYYSLPKSKKKDSTNHAAAAALFFSGGGGRHRNNKSTSRNKASSRSRNKHNGQIVCCSMEGMDAVMEETMDGSMQSSTDTQQSSKTQTTEPPSESVTIIDQLIDALDFNFLLKSSSESLVNSPQDSVYMLASSSSSPSSSSSSEVYSSMGPSQASTPIPSPPLTPRAFRIMPTVKSSLNFAEMGGSMLSRDIAWDILFQRYIVDELEDSTT